MKIKKGYVLLYDRCSLPSGATAKEIYEIIKRDNICFYDSSTGADIPKVVKIDDNKKHFTNKIQFIDVKKIPNEYTRSK